MKRRLHIELTGPSPDLGSATEGVSLRFFANFSIALQAAYRRAAQGVLTGVIQDEGRLPDRARDVDIRLLTASEGSLQMNLAPVDMGRANQPALPMAPVDMLAVDALDMMLDVLQTTHSATDPANVPRAFRALVGGMSSDIRQRYSLMEGDNVLREVVLTSSGVDAVYEPVTAGIRRVGATVRGVTFAPRPGVTLDVNGAVVKASAAMAVVRAAMAMHAEEFLVATLVTTSAGSRLIGVGPRDEAFPRSTPTVRETLDRFSAVMKILAQ